MSNSREDKKPLSIPGEDRYNPRPYVAPLFPREEHPSVDQDRGQQQRAAVVDRSYEFVTTVAINDIKASERFLRQYPEILREKDLQKRYLDPATQALAREDTKSRYLAFSYMEKCSIIALVKNRGDDGLIRLMERDGDAVSYFKAVFERIKVDCETKARLVSARQNPRAVRSEDDDMAARMSDMNMNDRRHERRGHSEPLDRVRIGELNMSIQRHGRHGDSDPPSKVRDSVEYESSERASTVKALPRIDVIFDNRFRILPPRELSWFRVGRVFAVKIYSEYNERDDYSMQAVRTSRGSEVKMNVRRMVVVKVGHEFCQAAPINTYGGRGLKKAGFTASDINAHARIHMVDRTPVWLEEEPRTAKRDIAVRPHDGQQLHPASRICFERSHSIEYSQPILKIGTVIPECLVYLKIYWDQEIHRSSATEQRPMPTPIKR